MKVLAISTSQSRAAVAWMNLETEEFRQSEFSPIQTGELLRSEVAPLLIRGVDLVAVDIGPGSYTGTRVGVAFAQGIANARPIPWVGISTWKILARIAPSDSTIITASKSGEVMIRLNETEVVKKPLRDLVGSVFGFPCSDPVKYGGYESERYLAPDFEQYLRSLIVIAASGDSEPSLPVYYDNYSTQERTT